MHLAACVYRGCRVVGGDVAEERVPAGASACQADRRSIGRRRGRVIERAARGHRRDPERLFAAPRASARTWVVAGSPRCLTSVRRCRRATPADRLTSSSCCRSRSATSSSTDASRAASYTSRVGARASPARKSSTTTTPTSAKSDLTRRHSPGEPSPGTYSFSKELGAHARGRRLLDVGCGDGQLLQSASEAGWQAFGIDLSEPAVRLCRNRGLDAAQIDFHSSTHSTAAVST